MSCWRSIGVAGLLGFALACPAAAGAEDIPRPDADPFYAAPAGLESQAPGSVLRSREVTITFQGTPLPAKAWQVLYRSNDSKERPIAAIATVLVPLTPYPGRRPLVSYQAAIDSLGSHCNPSYTLRTGTQRELIAIVPMLAAGWGVVVPDFEGPRNAYAAGPVAAHTVLDGIRAAKRFAPAGLTAPDTPVALWGYSGGGQASAWAAERQPAYAPELDIDAVAAGGVPPDVEQVARQIDGGPFFGVYLAASVGLSREFPELDLDSLLNEEGKALKEKVGTQCANELVLGYPNRRMSELTTVPDPLVLPRVREVIAANRLGKATPRAPLFIYHSTVDQLIPVAGVDALVAKYCSDGAILHYQRDVAGEHIGYAFTGGTLAYNYLAARFAGVPAPRNCSVAGGPPTTPPAAEECARGRAITLRPRRRRGERIRSLVARLAGRRVASQRGRDLRAIRVRGLRPGRYTIRLRIRSTRGTRTVTLRRTVRCR